MDTATAQGITFLATLMAGVVTGLIFDIYRLMRGATRPKGVLTLLEDVLFWLLITVILFYTLIRSNWGEVRLYIFIGWATGALLYKVTVSSLVVMSLIGFVRCCGLVFDGIVSMLTYLYDALARPFALLAYRLKRHRISKTKEERSESGRKSREGIPTRLFRILGRVFSKYFIEK